MGEDLLSSLIGDAKAWADPLVSSYASGNRIYRVRISRPGELPSYNRDSGAFSNPDDTLVYEGPARIYPVSGGPTVLVGDEVADVSQVKISIDDSTEPNGDGGVLYPQLEDLIEVLPDGAGVAGRVVGRWFTITDVEVGGHFEYGWMLTGTGTSPSRRT